MDKGKIQQIIVNPSEAGQRLDLFLAAQIDRLSRARIQALIRSGHILLNGKTCRGKQSTRPGDEVTVFEPEPEPIILQPEALAVPILFEDEHLLVVNKPAGMTVHPGAGIQSGTLVNALLHQVTNLSGIGGELRPGVVHRLDKETSGCLVVAKHDVAHLRLSNQFAGRKVQKFYLALCNGRFTKSAGEIIKPIGRHPVHRQKMAILDRGRPAHTRYRGNPGNKPLGSGPLPDLHRTNTSDSRASPFDRAPGPWRQSLWKSVQRIWPADVACVAFGLFSSDCRELVGIRSRTARRFSEQWRRRKRDCPTRV